VTVVYVQICKRFSYEIGKIYILNELPSQRTHINVSLIQFECPLHAGNKNYRFVLCDIRPYLSGEPLKLSDMLYIRKAIFIRKLENSVILLKQKKKQTKKIHNIKSKISPIAV
jgi:hypothetical protein